MQAERAAVWPTVARDDEFHRALSALDDTSGFRGVALIGSSGVGKSTLARVMAGLLPQAKGTVKLDGKELEGSLNDRSSISSSSTTHSCWTRSRRR